MPLLQAWGRILDLRDLKFKIKEIGVPKVMVSLYVLEGLGLRV